ncbi:hypothetical protein HO133_003231 [Letharia lupina]|uniref:J domain-containing protein n=1 Tax=Letharia lupina TaxID=560253 RepID=A0A8H6F9F9_9LECA|nr:uncharacterized protein HO133_003231 [Letharia lupina]KAF6220100.1 hypothetical protein HO133_003231 [Letharia lupina]
MSRPSPTLNSKRFFLSFHRYISMTSSPLTHHPHLPAQATTPQRHPSSRPRSRLSARHASTSDAPPSAPAKPLSHYDLFPNTLPQGAPPRGPFVIDPRQLRKEFLQLQARAHPDRHHGPDKARAEGTSALINEAYRTLQNPLPRAQYLLSLRGIDVAEDETAKVEDPDLLMEVLEVREAIEGAGQESELEGMKARNDARMVESEGILDEAFQSDDTEMAKAEAVKLRYWTNIKEALDAWEKGKPVVLVH